MTSTITVALQTPTARDHQHAESRGLHALFDETYALYGIDLEHQPSAREWLANNTTGESDQPQPLIADNKVPVRVLVEPDPLSPYFNHALLAAPVALLTERPTLQRPPPLDVDAVIFDVDGTLVDSLKAYFTLAERAAAHHDLSVEWPVIKTALNENTLNFWELIVPQSHPNRADVMTDMQQRARALWPEVLAARVTLMPSTQHVVTTLVKRGIRLGIVTSSGGDAMLPMDEAGLSDHFTSVITRHDVKQRKPDPEGILAVLNAVDVEPHRAAYVGDSIMDVRAARNAGVVAIGVLCGSGDAATLTNERPHYLFADTAGLVQLLE